MRSFLISFLMAAAVASGPLFPGKAAAAPQKPGPEREEINRLVLAHNQWSAGLRSVRASGKARVGAEREKTRVFDFSLVCSRPGSARLQGRWGSLANIFDLSGTAAGWTLYLPRDRSVVRAENGDTEAGLLLPPIEIISVLLPAGIPPRDLETRGTATLEGEEFRLVVPPGKGGAGSAFHRVLWVDPDNGRPRKVEIRRETQLEPPILVAHYEEYEGKGAKAFPVRVRVELVEAGSWAQFDFETVRINTEIPSDIYALRVPAGTQELAPEDLTPDFLPEEN